MNRFALRRWIAGPQLAIVGLVLAAAIHLMLAPQHFHESAVLGLGFAGVGLAQLLIAALLRRSASPLLWASALGVTSFSLSMYLLAHTVGLPWGHPHAMGESALALLCKSGELVAIASIVACLVTGHAQIVQRIPARLTASRYALAIVALGLGAALFVVQSGNAIATSGTAHDHATTDVHSHQPHAGHTP